MSRRRPPLRPGRSAAAGVETETSTPQLSLKSHWFFGWLTRATTRGTANSCLASSEMTRLSSSSPVAATTTSTVASPARSREETSQASAATQVMSSVGRRRSTSSGSCSKRSTSWPLACRSDAMAVPTLPAPAMATFTSHRPRGCLRCGPACRRTRATRRRGRRCAARRPPGPPGPGHRAGARPHGSPRPG